MNGRKSKAVVTLSGGADSATILYLAIQQCEEVHAISINYGQRHVKELEGAKNLCKLTNIKHIIVPFDLTIFGGSPLTDKNIEVPAQCDQNQSATVVPYRNTFIAMIAAAYCKANKLNTIYMGPTYEDLANYEDCRPVYFEALQQLVLVAGTVHDLEIRTPFITTCKQQIIQIGQILQVPYGSTWTCIVDDNRNKVNRAIGSSCRPSKIKVGDELLAIDEITNELVKTEVKEIIKKEASSFYLITLENGKKLRVTGDHRVYTTEGWVQAQDLTVHSVLIHSSPLEKKRKFSSAAAGKTLREKYGEIFSKNLKLRWAQGLMPKTPKGTEPPAICGEKSSLRTKGKTYKEIYGGEKSVKVRGRIGESVRKWRKNNPDFNPMNNPTIVDKIVKSNQKHMKACSRRMKLHNPMFDIEIAGRSIKTQQERPSGPEKILIGLIEKYKLPLTYCGDGSFWIKSASEGQKKNLNPDFKVNGEQKVLEIYTPDYPWREKNWIEKRKNLLNAAGYAALFVSIRTDRKNDEEEIVQSINQFIHNGLKVIKISKVEKEVTVYDYACFPYHNFLLNWVVVHNCYQGEDVPCMICDACRERMESFRVNGIRDPLISEDKWAEYMKEFEKENINK